MTNEDWRSGVIAGVVTPFDGELCVDARALVPYLHFLAESGVSAVVVNADTGEGQHLSQTERLEVLRIAVNEIGGRVVVLSGLIADFTQEAAEAAKQFRALGSVRRLRSVLCRGAGLVGSGCHPEELSLS